LRTQVLSGCILGTEKPDLALDVPGRYRAAHGTAAVPALDWWRGFRSRELTSLVEKAHQANFDIVVAIAQILQPDAQVRIAGAPLLRERRHAARLDRNRRQNDRQFADLHPVQHIAERELRA
jgi:outer membrane protein TolC